MACEAPWRETGIPHSQTASGSFVAALRRACRSWFGVGFSVFSAHSSGFAALGARQVGAPSRRSSPSKPTPHNPQPMLPHPHRVKSVRVRAWLLSGRRAGEVVGDGHFRPHHEQVHNRRRGEPQRQALPRRLLHLRRGRLRGRGLGNMSRCYDIRPLDNSTEFATQRLVVTCSGIVRYSVASRNIGFHGTICHIMLKRCPSCQYMPVQLKSPKSQDM